MRVQLILGWQVGIGAMASKDGVAIFLPVVMVFVEFGYWKRFDFSIEKHF